MLIYCSLRPSTTHGHITFLPCLLGHPLICSRCQTTPSPWRPPPRSSRPPCRCRGAARSCGPWRRTLWPPLLSSRSSRSHRPISQIRFPSGELSGDRDLRRCPTWRLFRGQRWACRWRRRARRLMISSVSLDKGGISIEGLMLAGRAATHSLLASRRRWDFPPHCRGSSRHHRRRRRRGKWAPWSELPL